MNKRLLTLFFALISWVSVFSQKDTVRYWGVNLSSGLHATLIESFYKIDTPTSAGYGLDLTQERYLFTPSVLYGFNKHTISFGPRFYLPENNYKRFGTQFAYDYLLNKKQKKVNFTLSMDIIYSYEKFEKERILSIGNTLYMSNWKLEKNYLHSLIFLGMRTFIINDLYFDLRAGVGVGLQSMSSIDEVNELPDCQGLSENKDLFSSPEFNGMIKVGIGYIFK